MLKQVGKAIRSNVLLGLFLVTPLVVTLYIVQLLFHFATGNPAFESLVHVLPETLRDTGIGRFLAQVLALVLVLMTLFLIGFFVRSFIGKHLYNISEGLIARIPVFNKIYLWVRSISESILAQRQTLFQEVVLVEYPRRGVYSLGFVTAPTPRQFSSRIGEHAEDLVSLFIPTTPNPTSGMMIMAPRAQLVPIRITVQEAMKFIISAGAVTPGEVIATNRPTLLDKLEMWLTREGRGEG